MTLLVQDILQRMKKLAQPELKEKFRGRGLDSVEFGLTDRALLDLHKEMGPQPFAVLEELWQTGFYECRWLALLALEVKDLDRTLVEAWGPDLADRAQAQSLAAKMASFAFVPRRLKSWLESEHRGLSMLAEEWLWLKVREAETSPRSRAEVVKLAPKIKEILLQEERAPFPLWTRIQKLVHGAATTEKFTPLGQRDEN